MLESGRSQWRKLDNAALAFPAVTGKKDTRVFRFYCQLKESVDGPLLQQALDKTMEKYPLYQMVLRKGLFWFYLEHRDIKALVKEEDRPPCSNIYIPDKKSLLFDVSYYKNRINFEVFHALTDGTGAMQFFQELVKNYLVMAHPEAGLPDLPIEEDTTLSDQEEDSFSQYYSTDLPRVKEHKKPAYQLRGELLEQEEMHIMEVVLSVKDTLRIAREHGVSITVLLAAMMIWAIHEEVPRHQSRRPINLMVPVNLRNYFPSRSMANFFGWIEVGYEFHEDTTFDDVLSHIKELFQKELVKERIGQRMNELVRLEKNPLLRAVPLEIKKFFLQLGTTLGGRSLTAIYSNVGIIKLPSEFQDYIEQFGVFTSTDKLQFCSCSFGDRLVLGMTSKIPSQNIQRNFLSQLKQHGLDYREEKNDFPGLKKDRHDSTKILFQIFTFLCLAATVISCMINYSVTKTLDWAWFVAAGCFCGWLIAVMAFKKRWNLLKNSMWQLLMVSGLSVLWDLFTGRNGWSVDFVIPIASLATLVFMMVTVKVQHLEESEYLFYFLLASGFGYIPLILLLCNVVTITLPSVICVGVSLLFSAGLFIFRRKHMLREIRKKFRL